MHCWTSKIRGVSYQVSMVNGELVYDPPLPVEELSSDRFDDMIAARRGPHLDTDTYFMSGRGTLDQQFADDPEFLEELTTEAKARGYTPKPNDVYLQGLATEGVGDPKAFVPNGEGKGYIKKVCEERNLECKGSVNVSARKDIGPSGA